MRARTPIDTRTYGRLLKQFFFARRSRHTAGNEVWVSFWKKADSVYTVDPRCAQSLNVQNALFTPLFLRYPDIPPPDVSSRVFFSQLPLLERKGFQQYRIPRFQDSMILWFQHSNILTFQDSSVPGFQDCSILWFRHSSNPAFQHCKIPGFPDFNILHVEFQHSSVPSFQDSRISVSQHLSVKVSVKIYVMERARVFYVKVVAEMGRAHAPVAAAVAVAEAENC